MLLIIINKIIVGIYFFIFYNKKGCDLGIMNKYEGYFFEFIYIYICFFKKFNILCKLKYIFYNFK